MKWTSDKTIRFGLWFGVVVLCVIGVVSYRSMTQLIKTSDSMAQIHHVLENLENVSSLLQNAESGQRGYIITGDDRFLVPYETATKLVDKELKALRQLTKDNAEQQRLLNILEPLVAQQLQLGRETIRARDDKGFNAAALFVRAERGSALTEDIRRVIEEMQGAESALLAARQKETESTARNTLLVIVWESVLAIGLVGFGGFILTERKRTQNKIKQLSLVATRTDNAVLITDGNGCIEWVNDSFTRITEWKAEEVKGKKLIEVLRNEATDAATVEYMYA